jgi:hypothetical protein
MTYRSLAVLALVPLALVAAGCGASSSPKAAPATTAAIPSNAAPSGATGGDRALPAAFTTCLKQHGVTLPAGGFRRPPGLGGFKRAPGSNGTPPAGGPSTNRPPETPAQAKRRAAFTACSRFAPRGGFGFGVGRRGGAFAAYAACMQKQGITFGRRAPVNLASPKFKAAAKQCKSLLPAAGTGGAGAGSPQ